MTPDQRFKRLERMLGKLATRGRVVRNEFRDKINILIDAQIRNEEVWLRHKQEWRAETRAINEQIKATDEQIKNVALAQAELTKSQKLTDRALRDFINSLRKSRNGR